MRIAVVSNGALSLRNFRGPLIAEMVRRGHEVLAFAPDHDEGSRAALEKMGVRAVDYAMDRVGTNPVQEFGSLMDLRRVLAEERPDVCFSYVVKPVIYGTIAASLAGVGKRYGLISGLGFAFVSDAGQGWRRRVLQGVISVLTRFASARIDQMMFQNGDDLEEFVAKGLVAREKTVLIGATGIDVAEWGSAPMPDGPVTFILVARMLRDKGVEQYITAARVVRAAHPQARFLLVGGLDDNPTGIKRAEIEAWVAEGLVEWPGHVAVKPWLEKAHVFVLPSYYREGVPRSTQEAMALGRPVITTDMPGCRETVEDGRNGFIVPPRDAAALAEAMQRFLDQPDIIEQMGRESRCMAEERFDVHVQNGKLLDVMGL